MWRLMAAGVSARSTCAPAAPSRSIRIDTDRTIAFPGFFDRATAHYDGRHRPDLRRSRLRLRVRQRRGRAVRGRRPGCGSTPTPRPSARAAAALNIAGTTFEVGYSTLGIRAASLIPLGDDMVLIPRASAGVAACLRQRDAGCGARVPASRAVPFVISGVPIARDALLAEAGLDLAIGRNATLGVSYVGQIARNVRPRRQGQVQLAVLEHDPEKACPGLDPGCASVFGRSCSRGPVDSHRSHKAIAATVMMARKFLAVFS